MNSNLGKGELWLRKRKVQRIIFIVICSAIGGFIGLHYQLSQNRNSDLSLIGYVESIPFGWALSFSLLMIALLIYNWIRFDEFERPRYDRSSSFGLFSSLLIIPWYVASLQGAILTPHPIACLFIIFGSKWLFHAVSKYKS